MSPRSILLLRAAIPLRPPFLFSSAALLLVNGSLIVTNVCALYNERSRSL
jgi:hypothetical protein